MPTEATCPRCKRAVKLDEKGRFTTHGPDPAGHWICRESWKRPRPRPNDGEEGGKP